MPNRKTILHIIQNFGRGGAETAVVGVLKNLKEYRNVVVTLDPLNQFGDELEYDALYCLNLKSYYLFPFAIFRLRNIIRDERVDIVHSQLYWSTVLARFATPTNIPLITSIQASLTNSVEYKKNWIGWLDRYSYQKRPSTILGVSKHTLDDYFQFLALRPGKTGVLYNFVDTGQFQFKQNQGASSIGHSLRLVTVGNLKPQKNQLFLLRAMQELSDLPVSLDIYGDGQLEKDFARYIEANKVHVRLMGKVSHMQERLPEYDLFVMSSLYEGFSLAVLEGMAMGLPMLLSDIPTFREQAEDTAKYFPLDSTNGFTQQIRHLYQNRQELTEMSIRGKERVLAHFTLTHHLAELRAIYRQTLHQ